MSPRVAPRPRPVRAAATGPFLAARFRRLALELEATLPRVMTSDDDEAIHDMRVVIRRMRVLLKLARPVYGRFHADAVRALLTHVHRASGALRDEEVLRETFGTLHIADPAFGEWVRRRAAREEVLRRAMLQRLRTGILRRALRLLRAMIALPVPPRRRVPLADFARRAAERARREVEKRRDVETDDVAGLHQLRIAYKGLRYTTELLGDALPSDVAAMAAPAARFQKRLGEIHDMDVARATLARARSLGPDLRARAVAAVTWRRREKVDAYLKEMRPSQARPGPVDGRRRRTASR